MHQNTRISADPLKGEFNSYTTGSLTGSEIKLHFGILLREIITPIQLSNVIDDKNYTSLTSALTSILDNSVNDIVPKHYINLASQDIHYYIVSNLIDSVYITGEFIFKCLVKTKENNKPLPNINLFTNTLIREIDSNLNDVTISTLLNLLTHKPTEGLSAIDREVIRSVILEYDGNSNLIPYKDMESYCIVKELHKVFSANLSSVTLNNATLRTAELLKLKGISLDLEPQEPLFGISSTPLHVRHNVHDCPKFEIDLKFLKNNKRGMGPISITMTNSYLLTFPLASLLLDNLGYAVSADEIFEQLYSFTNQDNPEGYSNNNLSVSEATLHTASIILASFRTEKALGTVKLLNLLRFNYSRVLNSIKFS